MSTPRGGRGGARGRGGPSRRGRPQPEIGPDGKEINPYIPRYIANAPWYLEKSDDYLEHQRSHKDKDFKGEWYDNRGQPSSKPAPKKFQKGACTNCGSMAHQAKDCLERPRKIGAGYSGVDLRTDEAVKDIRTTWDSKRDRWNGYDAEEYKKVIERKEEEERKEAEKKRLLEEKEQEKARIADDLASDQSKKKSHDDPYGLDSLDYADSNSDLDLDSDDNSKKEAPSTRTLRTREDKAKYLQDLSEDAAVFNPKSRTLRTEEEGTINERGQFIRKLTDKAADHDKMKKIAEKVAETGNANVHLEKGPTAALLQIKTYTEEKKKNDEEKKKALLAKYGGQQYLTKRKPQEIEEAPVEEFVEYDDSGSIKTEKKDEIRKSDVEEADKKVADTPKSIDKVVANGGPIIPNKYLLEEDVYPGNHKSVWGSYWKDFKWGYACCHSLIKQSYCTGETGRMMYDEDMSRKFLALGNEEDNLKKRRKLDS